MQLFSRFKNKKTTLKRKLLLYMLALAFILLSLLTLGLYSLGRFSSAKKNVANDLSFQADIFNHQVSNYFEDLVMMGTSLSKSVSNITQQYLDDNSISIADVNNHPEHVRALEFATFDLLKTETLKTHCSGSFIIFNATVNTKVLNSQNSKAGLYFQRNTIDATDNELVLFRGHSDLCKEKGIMSHRKWRLEFDTSLIPNYDDFVARAKTPIEESLRLTDVFVIPRTSEEAIVLFVPIISEDGSTLYGFCGFEITESYFINYFAQASQIEQLTVLLTKRQGEEIDTEKGFSVGVFDGYYVAPKDVLKLKDFGNGLSLLTGKKSYVGLKVDTDICNDGYSVIAMIPKQDYDKMQMKNTSQIFLLTAFILFTTIICCIFFSRRFLSPILKGLEQIHKSEHKNNSSEIIEISDLFVYLAEQDKIKEREADELRLSIKEHKNIIETQKNAIDKLHSERKNEISSDDYEMFKMGIKSLTRTEKLIFNLYLDGKSASDILSICNIQESTLKYHNHNILEKLGVSSRKQMLKYAVLLENEKNNNS